jgi:hypothetical protein
MPASQSDADLDKILDLIAASTHDDEVRHHQASLVQPAY